MVVAVVAILASVTIVGYGAWRQSVMAAAIKSDLNGVASAMESERTFNDSYPQMVPASFTPSSGVLISGGGSVEGDKYCVDGTSTEDSSITYYISSETKDQGAQEGTCATRPNLSPPAAPSNVVIGSSVGTQVGISWAAVTDAASYTAQCASDAGFVFGMGEATSTSTNATITGLTPSTTFYCRVKAINGAGSSDWSATVSTDTTSNYGSLAVGTSIEGYWNSPPKGFLLEDGSAISRTVYADLFAVIGTTYGAGDGSTTFNLPDSRGRTGVNQSSDVEFATVGQLTGSQTEVLTIAQIPSHTHTQNSHTHSVNDPGHNHSQNAHSHAQYVTALSGGSGARNDWDSDGDGGIYNQGAATGYATATNNYTDPNLSVNSATATNQSNGGGGEHNNIQPSIVKVSAIKYAPIDSSAAQLPAGTSIAGYWTSVPSGYLEENGAAVSRSTYGDLFSAIGTTYGTGNGSTTFNVPDSRGRASVNLSSDTEFNAMGEKPGAKRETLTITQIPSHTHTQNSHTHSINDPGHNHTQNPHYHAQVVTANSGTAVRWDHNSDTAGQIFPQGVNTQGATATNNPITVGLSVDAATATNQNTGGGGDHNEIQPSIVKKYAIKATPATTSGTQLEPGTSIAGYWSSAPSGYLIENGAAVSRTTYAKLFAVIGTTYGAGNGSTTFNLPDSRGRLSVNRDPSDSTFDVIGEKTGAKTVVLTIAQIPSHNHTQNAHSHTSFDPAHTHTQNAHAHVQVVTANSGGSAIRRDFNADASTAGYPQGMNTGSTTATNNAAYTGVTLNAATATNQNTGGGGSHNNIQPSIVKLFVIKY